MPATALAVRTLYRNRLNERATRPEVANRGRRRKPAARRFSRSRNTPFTGRRNPSHQLRKRRECSAAAGEISALAADEAVPPCLRSAHPKGNGEGEECETEEQC